MGVASCLPLLEDLLSHDWRDLRIFMHGNLGLSPKDGDNAHQDIFIINDPSCFTCG